MSTHPNYGPEATREKGNSLDEKDSPAEFTVSVPDADGEVAPTEEEMATLRKVPGGIPWVVLLMCLVEFTERCSYYGTQTPFNNFINKGLPKGGNGAGAVAPGKAGLNQSAGALGRGSVTASALTKMFTFLAYVIPIYGGIIADNRWGRFKTICVGTAVGALAHVILVIPAIPQVIAVPNASLATFIISIIILAFAAGFIKPSVAPLLCDQSPVKTATIQYTKTGEKVILDPQATVSRYMLIFYICINLGSLIGHLSANYSARFVGFWLAFLIPGLLYMALPPLLWYLSPRLLKVPPTGTVVPDALRVLKICFSSGGWRKLGRADSSWWARANPDQVIARGEPAPAWDDKFVEEIRQTMSACVVFVLIPIFTLANGGIGNALNDMSVAMTLNGVPNDLLNAFNPLAIAIFGPILTYGLYPFCERIGYPIKPMWRMWIGFMLACLGAISAALIQDRVYKTSPCGNHATTCEEVSPVSLWLQMLPYFLPAIGELFVNVTSYELAYTRSPPRMKGLVYSLALFNSAISAAISMALSKVVDDPYLVWTWVALAAATFVTAWFFPLFLSHLNEFNFTWSEEDKAAAEAIQKKRDAEMAIKDEDKY